MEEVSTVFVGLDVHAQSTAIAVAHVGREAPRFVGTVGARLGELPNRGAQVDDTPGLGRRHRRVGQIELRLVALRLGLREARNSTLTLRLPATLTRAGSFAI